MDLKYTDMVSTPVPDSINRGLSAAKPSTLLRIFGKPGSLTTECSAITNSKLKGLMVTQKVGLFKVTGIQPAVTSLRGILNEVRVHNEKLYTAIETAGMTCCRAVRGSNTTFSNHSWGCAVDLRFGGQLDDVGDNKTQYGLLLLYPFFHAAGWYWGAEFGPKREDSMHFEVSDELLNMWERIGLI